MTQIVIIAAIAQNGVIGNKEKNDIPWRISEDFLHFKELTMGYPCVMGDTTFESLPPKFRPLPGRENIVLTFDKNYHPEGTTIFRDFKEAIDYVKSSGAEKAFITGGASVYKQAMDIADVFELTRVNKDIEGDILFPEIDWKQWKLIRREDKEGIDKISGDIFAFSFLTYRKIRRGSEFS